MTILIKATNIGFKLAFENHSAKDISGFLKQGISYVSKICLEIILKRLTCLTMMGLKQNSTSTYEGSIDYNEFMADDAKLLNTSLDKLNLTLFLR
ncbi:hypothetical protein ACKUZO_021340 [Acinetobacter baumannii]